jgi:hypothetical protein
MGGVFQSGQTSARELRQCQTQILLLAPAQPTGPAPPKGAASIQFSHSRGPPCTPEYLELYVWGSLLQGPEAFYPLSFLPAHVAWGILRDSFRSLRIQIIYLKCIGSNCYKCGWPRRLQCAICIIIRMPDIWEWEQAAKILPTMAEIGPRGKGLSSDTGWVPMELPGPVVQGRAPQGHFITGHSRTLSWATITHTCPPNLWYETVDTAKTSQEGSFPFAPKKCWELLRKRKQCNERVCRLEFPWGEKWWTCVRVYPWFSRVFSYVCAYEDVPEHQYSTLT